jgi:plastocyanin
MKRLGLVLGLVGFLLAAPAALADVYMIHVSNFTFQPSEITILAGDTVGWRNYQGDHSTTSDDGDWDSGVQLAPWGFLYTFTDPGDYYYHCSLHAAFGMTGVVHVITPEG